MPLFCILLAATAASPAKAQKPGVAVTELKAVHGIEASLAQVLNEVLLARLKESGVFSTVIGSSDIAAMIDMEQQKAALGCDDTSCLAELGGALGVPYLIDSSVSRVGDQYVITLKVLSVDDARVAARKVAMVANEAKIIAALEAMIPQVLATLEPAPPPAAPAAAKKTAEQPPAVTSAPGSGRTTGWVVGALGLGSLAGGLWLLDQVRGEFETAEADPYYAYDVDDERARQSMAQVLIVGGLAASGAGAIWAVTR